MSFSITWVRMGSLKPSHHFGLGLVWVLMAADRAAGSFHLATSGAFGGVKSGPTVQADSTSRQASIGRIVNVLRRWIWL